MRIVTEVFQTFLFENFPVAVKFSFFRFIMLKHVLFLFFLYGIKNGSSDPQEKAMESKEIFKNGMKKNEVGANGVEANWDSITRNFQNPVLEYLLQNNPERTMGPPQRGVVREIRHSQTLLFPNFLGAPLAGVALNQLPLIQSQTKPAGGEMRNPDDSPFDSFWNFLKNNTQAGESKIQESVISSPVLHFNKTEEGEGKEELTRIEMYPAVAVVIHSFDKDGSLKSSLAHFQPDFNSFGTDVKEASHISGGRNSNKNHKIPNRQHMVSSYLKSSQNPFSVGAGPVQKSPQGILWPFANSFPINNPFLGVYSRFPTGMYNAVSSMVEYGPEKDICADKSENGVRDAGVHQTHVGEANQETGSERMDHYRESVDMTDSDIFDEVTMRSNSFKRTNRKALKTEVKVSTVGRKRRDATSIYVKSREGETVGITLEEPVGSNVAAVNTPDERARSFSPVLVNTPPLSTILRPPQQESRQFLGYADKKRKTKPSKPIKEEGNSEEVGEEHEEESTSVSQEHANEGVAISPPPEGASVAEAKPIGLAIAGPGGVAASKPQGTAVAGPGGLAIARPVGTAIAGVEVEGSVPIGGQQKNKKKPKQEQEQTDAELHYVGGLTGPIGNPQPKEFADSIYYKTVKETEGNNLQENFLRGRPNPSGFHLKLGQQNGKYGFIPMFANPPAGEAVAQKRMGFPIFFHGLLGNNDQAFDQFQNFRAQF